jgi:hypothetical protein
LTLYWHDGGNLPTAEQFGGEIPTRKNNKGEPQKTENGSLFIGDKGILFDGYDGGEDPRLLPAAKMEGFKAPDKSLPRSPGHYQEWIGACKGGPKAGSDFAAKSAGLTEMVLIGHLAARIGPGKKIEWDGATGKSKNLRETDQYVNKTYRKGWID